MGDLLNQVYVKCVQKEQHSIVSHCVLPLNDEIAFFFLRADLSITFLVVKFPPQTSTLGGKKKP